MAEELLEIIINAVDNASDAIQGVVGSAEDMQSSVEATGDAVDGLDGSGFDNISQSADGAEAEVEETTDSIDSLSEALGTIAGAEIFSQLSDALMDLADKAGTVQDSMTRLGLAAEGAGISSSQMQASVNQLANDTGRAGSDIRESMISMTSAGITNMDAMQSMFRGASAQAFILGTDVNSLADKFSGMAMKSTLSERTLKGTGITMQELGDAMGMQGATIDEIKDKWSELDVNQRAAALGMAASANEGKTANDAYKNSWDGLKNQIDIAVAKIQFTAGQVLLPVLIPAMKIAANVLNGLGGVISTVMNGPLGGLVSVIGVSAAAFALAVPAYMAVSGALTFLTGPAVAAATALWATVLPLLPWIALGAAIVFIIYEIGKAFGWWTDAGSMIDAISSGVMRLWDAFINHPDVQAVISAISWALSELWNAITWAGQAVLEFFGITNSGQFDIVASLIQIIGSAWDLMSTPLRTVITLVQLVIGVFNQFTSGQLTLPGLVLTVLTTLLGWYTQIFTMIISRVVSFGSRLLAKGVSIASGFVKGVVSWLRTLPGKAYNVLITVVSRITSAGAKWVSAVKNEARKVVDGARNTLNGVAGAISGALSGVVNALTQPFKDAWAIIKPYYDKIKSALDIIPGGAFAGESAIDTDVINNTGIVENSTTTNDALEINDNLNLTLDLKNVPAGVSEDALIKVLTSEKVLQALTSNRGFQDLDAKVKQKLSLKTNRARGV